MTVNQRFIEFMELNKIQPKEIAEIFGLTKSGISAIKNEKSVITTKQIILIAERFKNLNIRWLLTGEGDIYAGGCECKGLAVEQSQGCKFCIEKEKRIADLELHRDDLRRQINMLEFELGKIKKLG